MAGELFENRCSNRTTLCIATHVARLVKAQINTRNKVRRTADKPDIGRTIGRPRLAEQRPIKIAQDGCRTALDHAFEHMYNLIGRHRIHHLFPTRLETRHWLSIPILHIAAFARLPILGPDDFAGARLRKIDNRRFQFTPMVDQH